MSDRACVWQTPHPADIEEKARLLQAEDRLWMGASNALRVRNVVSVGAAAGCYVREACEFVSPGRCPALEDQRA